MKHFVYLAIFTLSLLIIFSGCARNEERDLESNAPDETTAEHIDVLDAATGTPEEQAAELPEDLDTATDLPDEQPVEPVLLVESDDGSVVIRGIEEPGGGEFTSIIVEINGMSKTFNSTENTQSKHGKFEWYNVTNPTYWPELTVTDLDGDGTEEIVVILTYGYGTGVHGSTIHVLNPDFTEIPFPDSVEDANEAYSQTVEVNDDKRILHIQVDGKSYTLTFPDDYSHMWWDGWYAGNIVKYRVEGDQIVASVSVHISDISTSGMVEIYYGLEDGQFVVKEMLFAPSDYRFDF